MLTLTERYIVLIASTLIIGIFAGIYAGSRFPETNKARLQVYLGISIVTALITSILLVTPLLHP